MYDEFVKMWTSDGTAKPSAGTAFRESVEEMEEDIRGEIKFYAGSGLRIVEIVRFEGETREIVSAKRNAYEDSFWN